MRAANARTISALYTRTPKCCWKVTPRFRAFLERARKSAIIHVAAHSIVNAQAPSRSYIFSRRRRISPAHWKHRRS